MSGFPIRPTRNAFGPTLKDRRPVADPTMEIPAATFNLDFWTVAGVGLLSPIAQVLCSVPAGVLGVLAHAETWNPNQLIAGPTPLRVSTGIYRFTYAAQYADERGTLQTIGLLSGGVDLQGLGASGKALVGYCAVTAPNVVEVHLFRPDTNAVDDGPFLARFY